MAIRVNLFSTLKLLVLYDFPPFDCREVDASRFTKGFCDRK